MTHQHAIGVKIAEANNNNKKTNALLAELGGVCVCACWVDFQGKKKSRFFHGMPDHKSPKNCPLVVKQ